MPDINSRLEDWQQAIVSRGGERAYQRLCKELEPGVTLAPLYADQGPEANRPRRQAAPWQVVTRLADPCSARAQRRLLADLAGGASVIDLVHARPGALGWRPYSAAEPGLLLPEISDLAKLLDEVRLDCVILCLDADLQSTTRLLQNLTAWSRSESQTTQNWQVESGLDLAQELCLGAVRSELLAGGPALLQMAAEFSPPSLRISSASVHEAGGTASQELAYVLSATLESLRWWEQVGGDPADLLPNLWLSLRTSGEQFLEISKFRAMRNLWQLLCEELGATVSTLRLESQSSNRMYSQLDPWNNILRGTVGAFAAAVGGADRISILPFDALLGAGDGLSARIARNAHTILMEECGLHQTSDLAAGSGYVESLTDQLCEQAWQQFQLWEKDGGLFAAIEDGRLQQSLVAPSDWRLRQIAQRRRPLTGVSEFAIIEGREPTIESYDFRDYEKYSSITEGDPRYGAAKLTPRRDAEVFEKLRQRALASENLGRVYLATLGSLPEHSARMSFTQNLLAAGGISVVADIGGQDVAAIVQRCQQLGHSLAVICGQDQAYDLYALPLCQQLVAAGIEVWLAGRPHEELQTSLSQCGLTRTLYRGCDVVAALEQALVCLEDIA